jgi:putative Mg2+ transporter-C (MgtC) family protein
MHWDAWGHTLSHYLAPLIGRIDGIMVLRMVLTLLLCGMIGLERSAHERASGLRTHIMVGLGACLMTLAGGYGFSDLHTVADPMRIASYVVSGIGFLGAGAILRHGTTVRGLTTAASLWSAAGIGITVGVGMAGIAIVAALLMLFTLSPLQKWEARLRMGATAGDLAIHLTDDSEAVGKTLTILNRLSISVKRATIAPGAGQTAILRVELGRALRPEQVTPIVQRLLALKYVTRVDTNALNLDTEEEAKSDIVPMVEYDAPHEEKGGSGLPAAPSADSEQDGK